MTKIEVNHSGEIKITADGSPIAEFWLPERDRIDLIVKLLKSVKENPADKGGAGEAVKHKRVLHGYANCNRDPSKTQ